MVKGRSQWDLKQIFFVRCTRPPARAIALPLWYNRYLYEERKRGEDLETSKYYSEKGNKRKSLPNNYIEFNISNTINRSLKCVKI